VKVDGHFPRDPPDSIALIIAHENNTGLPCKTETMIKAVLILNLQGKIRLVHFYEALIKCGEQQELVRKVFKAISRRGDELCNFIDGFGEWPTADTRIVYRRYATLCFIFIVDSSESQLAILDIIQVFVETLDRCFENVCELDLIFHADKVQHVLMEIVMGGMVVETNKEEIFRAVSDMNKLAAGKVTSGSAGGSVSVSGYHR
jgi:AP-3 complex subunit sigma